LIEFAGQIRQWLRTADTRERVVERVRTCVEQKLSADDANSDDSKHTRSMPWDLIPLPSRELSLDEKCTVLAVIHDQVFSHDQINPWRTLVQELDAEDLSRQIEFGRQDDNEATTEDWPLDSNEENPPEHPLAVSYYILGQHLNRLSEEELAGIVELLEDVQHDESGGLGESDTESAAATRQQGRIEWLAKAMSVVQEHPDWSDSAIAQNVGRHPSQLSRSREYKIAAALARGDRSSIVGGFVVKNDDNGPSDVEAISDAPVEPDIYE
jgi:hypothetical protein